MSGSPQQVKLQSDNVEQYDDETIVSGIDNSNNSDNNNSSWY